MMNVDPAALKELLRLQLLNKMDFFSASAGAAGGRSDEDFADLLGQVMNMSGAGDKLQADAAGKMPFKPLAANGASLSYMTQSSLSGLNPSQFDPAIRQASARFGVQPSLVKAVVDAESSFNPRAVSKAGAKGLMQLMDGTGEQVGVTDPFDPEQNIHGGTRYLSDLLLKYNGNEAMALAAYNAGSGRVDRLGVKNDSDLMSKLHMLPHETQQYVGKVLRLKQSYEA